MENQQETSIEQENELDNLVKNEINRYTELLISKIKELKKEYRNLEFEKKIDKMFTVFYMDKIPDYKKFVNDYYLKFFKEFNNHHIALLSTMEEIDNHMQTIDELMEIGVPESEYSDSESISDKRSNHRKNK